MKNYSSMSGRLFFKLLPVQLMIVAMTSVNSIVDGIVAGRFIDSRTVGVIGLFSVSISFINAINSVILGGSSVLSGRYMGSGNIEKTRGIFSLDITLTSIAGIILTLMGLFFPDLVADICGTNAELKEYLELYIIGYSIGILPQMLSQQLGSFLQMERQSKRNYFGIGVMIILNITLNIFLVAVLDMGIFGLALSTSICNIAYFIVLVSYYFTGKAQLIYKFKNILWKDTLELVKIGFPGALLVFCLGAREIVINVVILRYAGQDGLSAKSALGMIACLFIALCLGTGSVVRMLASIQAGEEDKDSIKDLIRLCFTKVFIMSAVIAAVLVACSGLIAGIFFKDPESNVFMLARQYFAIYGISIPLILVVQIQTNYLQAMKQNICVNILSIIDGFVSVVLPTLILAPVMGALGVWLATPIGIVISAIVYPVYAIIFWKRIPRNADEWLLLKKDFGVSDSDRLVMSIKDYDDVSLTSIKIQDFCLNHGMDRKKSMYSALCLEEMTRNVIEHGFKIDKKKHYIDSRIVYKGKEVILRIKDDCKSFDPVSMSETLNSENVTDNIGIKMVMNIADSAEYQNLLGINVLTIILKNE